MPSIDVRQAAEELLQRTRVDRGLPKHIEDEAILARVAALLDAEPSTTSGDAA
jgi:hypothetical protein